MPIRIKIKDAKTLKDSIDALRKKIGDAEFDLTQQGVGSIANALLGKKGEIASADDFASLRDLVRGVVSQFDTPKAREILAKVAEFDRMYQRDPRKGGRNDYWMWEKLLKYVYNIILKASGNESPDVALKREYAERQGAKPEDSCKVGDIVVHADYKGNQSGDYWLYTVEEGLDANDRFSSDKAKAHKFASIAEARKFCEEHGIEDYEVQDSCGAKVGDGLDEIAHLVRLLGEAHNLIMEALDLANDLESEDKIGSGLVALIEDVEAGASQIDYEGNEDPVKALLDEYGGLAFEDPQEDEGFEGHASEWELS